MRIGIIGGGFTGCLLAVQLLRAAKPGTQITLIERSSVLGRGAAYGTDNPDHLLNVRAGNMGAFPDNPQDFHAWLTAQSPDPPPMSAFVSRKRYGQYIADVFDKAIAARPDVPVTVVIGPVEELHPGPQPAVSVYDVRLTFDRLALCIGNPPPGVPCAFSKAALISRNYIHNPWNSRDLAGIPPADDVLILGSGLTMADVIQSLTGQRHTGQVTVLSRHGFLPLRHEAARPCKMERPSGNLLEIFRTLRREAKAAPGRGHDWRDVIDALRPWTTEMWQALSIRERGQFLRHIRPHWEVHRHRLAPAIADTLDAMQENRQLTVMAARVSTVDWKSGGFEVAARPRGAREHVTLTPRWIVNCTGPQADYASSANPLVGSAVRAGALRPDALHLSLDVTNEGAVIDAHGNASPNIFAIGPPTRGAFWEITAVPDIRRDCARMADVLLRDQ
jgi:uncharacterized NAD(P)/FAD-binding protein YdhS